MTELSPTLHLLILGAGPALLVFCLSALASLGLTRCTMGFLIRKAQFDLPNERSSHKVPTPRGGGLAVTSVIILGLCTAFGLATTFFPGNETYAPDYVRLYLPLIGAALLLMGVSWIDDKKSISPKGRLATHLLAAAIGCMALPGEAVVFGDLLPFWLDRLLVIVGWAWFMNLYNFMDGIDGITSCESISLALGACLVFIFIEQDMPDDYQDYLVRNTTLAVLIAGAAFGFLFYNWHPAKIFLGDVGSVPLGFFTGFLLLHMAVDGALVTALILPLYYLVDSGLTITKRALRREKVWQAHREHFYQRAALALGRHDRVVLWVVKANLLLIGLALLSFEEPWGALVLAILVVSGLLSFMSKATIRA